jgi:hypothetical protein
MDKGQRRLLSGLEHHQEVVLVAIAALLFHQAAEENSLLSDAGNWAAIVAASILVLGLVFGWFRQVSHSLHVAHEPVALGADDEGVYVVLGLDLLNTAEIPLNYEVTKFMAAIGDHEPQDLVSDRERFYVAPQQRTDWHGARQSLEDYALALGPVRVARYEVEYGRKSRVLWRWRRVIRGSYGVDLPLAAERMTLLADQLDGPPTDTRVPWTSKTILGWRL